MSWHSFCSTGTPACLKNETEENVDFWGGRRYDKNGITKFLSEMVEIKHFDKRETADGGKPMLELKNICFQVPDEQSRNEKEKGILKMSA